MLDTKHAAPIRLEFLLRRLSTDYLLGHGLMVERPNKSLIVRNRESVNP